MRFNKYVADEANILSKSTETIINSKIQKMRNQTSSVMIVVTLKSLENQSCTDVALEIGRKYKVGEKHKNNGLVVLVAPNEREVRIEVGYGLEEVITDTKAWRIIDEYMLPYFRNNDYENGITQGSDALINNILDSYDITDNSATPQDPNNIITYAIFIIAILPLLYIAWLIIKIFLMCVLLLVEFVIVRKCISEKESKQVLTKFYKELKNRNNVLYSFLMFIKEDTTTNPRGRFSVRRRRGFGVGGGFGGSGAGRSW